MEIRNNTPMMNSPAFGMAFKKPSAELMEDFVDYVGRGISGNRAKKGLIQLQEQQLNNRHFDIITTKDATGDIAFKVVPKLESEKAQKMYSSGEVFESSYASYSPIKAAMKKNSAAREALGDKPNFLRKALVETGCLFRELGAEIKAAKNPIDELPGNLRAAAIEADKMEAAVDRALRKEDTIRSAFKP